MLLKTLVKNNNPIFYKIIRNAYKNEKISHAYLLNSAPDVDLDNESLLIIQAFVCQTEHVFACGECSSCQRVAINSYADLHILDGSGSLIKKDTVLMVTNSLGQTALEKDGFKILLIKSIDNTNKQSLNSLLKFIEEPTENTLIIMTTHHINNVLSTIRSRSQVIQMRPKSVNNLRKELELESINERYVNVISCLAKNKVDALNLCNNNFEETYRGIITSLKAVVNSKELGRRSLNSILKKGDNLKVQLSLMNLFFNDVWKYKLGHEVAFNEEKELLKGFNDIDFNYAEAIKKTWSFSKSLNYNANFELSKENYLIEIMENHGK